MIILLNVLFASLASPSFGEVVQDLSGDPNTTTVIYKKDPPTRIKTEDDHFASELKRVRQQGGGTTRKRSDENHSPNTVMSDSLIPDPTNHQKPDAAGN